MEEDEYEYKDPMMTWLALEWNRDGINDNGRDNDRMRSWDWMSPIDRGKFPQSMTEYE